MTDACETCIRWSECNGADAATCPFCQDREEES